MITNEQTAKKKEVVNANNVSVFRFHEFRKARSKGPNELEDTANMNRGPSWSTSSSSHHLATYRQCGNVTSSDYRNLRLCMQGVW
jgi:hypothetical protein